MVVINAKCKVNRSVLYCAVLYCAVLYCAPRPDRRVYLYSENSADLVPAVLTRALAHKQHCTVVKVTIVPCQHSSHTQ